MLLCFFKTFLYSANAVGWKERKIHFTIIIKFVFIIFHASVAIITFYSKCTAREHSENFLLNFHWILFHFSLPDLTWCTWSRFSLFLLGYWKKMCQRGFCDFSFKYNFESCTTKNFSMSITCSLEDVGGKFKRWRRVN
jgi:hypothetical protein